MRISSRMKLIRRRRTAIKFPRSRLHLRRAYGKQPRLTYFLNNGAGDV